MKKVSQHATVVIPWICAMIGGAMIQLSVAAPPAAIQVVNSALPSGVIGVGYRAVLYASGGLDPYTWTVQASILPPGLQLSAGGVLSGTPTSTGNYSITLRATDANGKYGSQSYTLTISTSGVTTTSLPSGVKGIPYQNTVLSATGGNTPYSWATASGKLPNGISLSSAGLVSGTPSAAGYQEFTVKATSANGQRFSQTLAINTVMPLTVSSSALPMGTIGRSYKTSMAASGGKAPYQWKLVAGAPPSVIGVDSTGNVVGTPTVTGSYGFTVQVSDASGQQATGQTSIAITGPLSITSAPLPNGKVGTSYSAIAGATGGLAPYTWKIAGGALPAGLSLSSGGGISGIPTTAGSSNFTLQATDSGGGTTSLSYTVSIVAGLGIITTNLPNGTVGTPYAAAVAATGGTAPYTWALSAGALPAGLALNGGGGISGTPSVAGSSTFTLKVTDAVGGTTSLAYTVSIAAGVVITTTSLPSGTTGVAYTATLAATGGTAPYAWSIASGLLPTGLGLGVTTGTISGTPSTAGTYNVTMAVTDSTGRQALKVLSLVIAAGACTGCPSLTITTTSLPNISVGVAYSTTLAATGGTAPYKWSILSGQLPPSITLVSSSGIISGTSSTAGSYTFVIQAADSAAHTTSQPYTVTVSAAGTGGTTITITNADLPNGTVSKAYTATLAATGGTPPYTWSVASGALPAGLTLSGSTGLISGTPSAAGWSNMLAIQARDSGGVTTSLQYSMIINPVLDLYGGLVGQSCAATGWFHTQKIGNRWWLCTPLGNVSWMTSLGGAFAPDNGCDTNTGLCNNYQTIAKSKYGDLDIHWGPQQNRRLQSWGFNSVGQLSSGWMYPMQTCSGCDGWPSGQQPVKLPATQTILVSNYAAINLWNYANHPVKNLMFGINNSYTGWRASLMDFYDPAFGQFVDNMIANDAGVKSFLTSPWAIGLFLDDTDWFWGMGAGPDFHTLPAGHTNAHAGYMTLVTASSQTYNPDPASRGVAQLYSDGKIYSKLAMASPPAVCAVASPCSMVFLYKKYNGSISALNQSWGSNYTTFDSTGSQVTGEVIGTGDGSKISFSHTLSGTPVTPESILISVGGAPQGGDCPWWNAVCSVTGPGVGSLAGPAGSSVISGRYLGFPLSAGKPVTIAGFRLQATG